jgi:hypothetical protein
MFFASSGLLALCGDEPDHGDPGKGEAENPHRLGGVRSVRGDRQCQREEHWPRQASGAQDFDLQPIEARLSSRPLPEAYH